MAFLFEQNVSGWSPTTCDDNLVPNIQCVCRRRLKFPCVATGSIVNQHCAEEAPLFRIEAMQTKFRLLRFSIISNYIAIISLI